MHRGSDSAAGQGLSRLFVGAPQSQSFCGNVLEALVGEAIR